MRFDVCPRVPSMDFFSRFLDDWYSFANFRIGFNVLLYAILLGKVFDFFFSVCGWDKNPVLYLK